MIVSVEFSGYVRKLYYKMMIKMIIIIMLTMLLNPTLVQDMCKVEEFEHNSQLCLL